MPIETTLWNINEGLKPVTFIAPDTEMVLEDMLFKKSRSLIPTC